jgi:hypothetical protein
MIKLTCRAAFCAALLAVTALTGCAMRMEMGAPPQLERLAELTPKQSSRNDVLLTLGEPRGYGAARLAPSLGRQQVWLYEHTVSAGPDIRLTMLLVFFDGDAYDGYMWFADAINLKEYRGGAGK